MGWILKFFLNSCDTSKYLLNAVTEKTAEIKFNSGFFFV